MKSLKLFCATTKKGASLVLGSIFLFTNPTAYAEQGTPTQEDDVYIVAGQSNAAKMFENGSIQAALRKAGRSGRVRATAKGGTGFTPVAGLDWNLSSTSELYDQLKDQINSLKYHKDIKSIIWVQGENETRGAARANRYHSRLVEFITKLRQDTTLPDLHVVIVQLSSKMPAASSTSRVQHWNSVIETQANVAKSMRRVSSLYVDAFLRRQGVAIGNPTALSDYLLDTIHWNKKGTHLLARGALALVPR